MVQYGLLQKTVQCTRKQSQNTMQVCLSCISLFGLGAHGKHVPVTHTRPVPLFIQPLPLSRRGLDSAVLPSRPHTRAGTCTYYNKGTSCIYRDIHTSYKNVGFASVPCYNYYVGTSVFIKVFIGHKPSASSFIVFRIAKRRYGLFSVTFLGSDRWNALPAEVRSSSSLHTFRNSVLHFLGYPVKRP